MSVRYIHVNVADDNDKAYLRRIYYSLRSDVNDLISNMERAINNLNNIDDNFANYYSVDYVGADSNVIANSKSDLQQRINDLRNVVIPNINREIRKLNE